MGRSHNEIGTVASTRWNRCSTECGCADVNVKDENCRCSGGCERGPKERKQMRRYGADVLISLKLWDGESETAICPLTALPFRLENGQIDKINPEAGYSPGNVCLVSEIGNQERGKLQQWGNDLDGVARYAGDVANASMGITVTRFCHLKNRPTIPTGVKGATVGTSPTQENVKRGPYGIA